MENEKITEKNKELFLKYENGNKEVITDILLTNDQLVVSIARKYYNKFSGYVEFDDLVQEGRLGLYEATIRFDVNKGYNFSTYSTYWIRKNVQEYIFSNLRLGTISKYYILKALKMKRFIDVYYLENKVYPTDDIISEKLNISIEQIIGLKMLLANEQSLDCFINNEEGKEMNKLIDILESDYDIEEYVMNKNLYNILIKLIDSLNEKDRFILLNRYGLLTGKTMTQEEIGEIYGCSKQAIYQVEKQALQKIKRKCIKYGLQEFIDY